MPIPSRNCKKFQFLCKFITLEVLLQLRISFDMLEIPEEEEFQFSHCCKSTFINFHGFFMCGLSFVSYKGLSSKTKIFTEDLYMGN